MRGGILMKKLSRIRLINWHYFEDETIELQGPTLITGMNTAGKSTILDAIQLILTTNTKKFNTAANEKGNRNLKGYVRCKLGYENNKYLRQGSIISFVALEFYEESYNRHFILGAKIDSVDEDSDLDIRWFIEEGRLEDLTFFTGNTPSMNEQFFKQSKKIQLVKSRNEAKVRFQRRLGNLHERFFEIIPKALAFKPMNNVKEFITNFILPEKTIDVAHLRENIELYKAFQQLLLDTEKKVEALTEIQQKYEQIIETDKEIKMYDVLIQEANILDIENQINMIEEDIKVKESFRKKLENDLTILENQLDELKKLIFKIEDSLNGNEIYKSLKSLEDQETQLANDLKNNKENVRNLINYIRNTLDTLQPYKEEINFNLSSLKDIYSSTEEFENKHRITEKFANVMNEVNSTVSNQIFTLNNQINNNNINIQTLEKEITNLKNKKLTYPDNPKKLRDAILHEFQKRSIRSEVYFLCDVLEITDSNWQNAIEGYLNHQRFYVIVEPKYYDVALQVYDQLKNSIHTAGLINTKILQTKNFEVQPNSLAEVVLTNEMSAQKYIQYILGRVIRCHSVKELHLAPISITASCMIYQNYVVRKMNPKTYELPYIGLAAYEIQLNKKTELYRELTTKTEILKKEREVKDTQVKAIQNVSLAEVKHLYDTPNKVVIIELNLNEIRKQLNQLRNNPDLIQLTGLLTAKREEEGILQNGKRDKGDEKSKVISEIEWKKKAQEQLINNLNLARTNFDTEYSNQIEVVNTGKAKLSEELKKKSPSQIVKNFTPKISNKKNVKELQLKELEKLQVNYGKAFENDLGWGIEYISDYTNEYHTLKNLTLTTYKEKLTEAQKKCEQEFRESFTARLRENIESARSEFNQLNKALQGLYYGDDSYHFKTATNKKKERFYKMIMSKDNVGGDTLFAVEFETTYADEMEELYEKLMLEEPNSEKVILEYTDYRNYLDYDIEIRKKDGNIQLFSEIYGEKSGGETQTPYYVAITASFVQLYGFGDTIRIMLLDEAFDKMDDGRIRSMLDFFNSQNIQVILATPPAKMEVIAEKVQTVLVAIREEDYSFIQEYRDEQFNTTKNIEPITR